MTSWEEGRVNTHRAIPGDREGGLVTQTTQSVAQYWTRKFGAQSSLSGEAAQRLLRGSIAKLRTPVVATRWDTERHLCIISRGNNVGQQRGQRAVPRIF